MHYQLLQLASQHVDELRHGAAAQRRAATLRIRSLRSRAGWTLVTIGLSLAAPAHPRPRTG
jgi:hypothetical protein